MNIYQKIVANLVSSELSTKYNFFDLQKNVLKSYAIEQIKKEYGEKVKNVQFIQTKLFIQDENYHFLSLVKILLDNQHKYFGIDVYGNLSDGVISNTYYSIIDDLFDTEEQALKFFNTSNNVYQNSGYVNINFKNTKKASIKNSKTFDKNNQNCINLINFVSKCDMVALDIGLRMWIDCPQSGNKIYEPKLTIAATEMNVFSTPVSGENAFKNLQSSVKELTSLLAKGIVWQRECKKLWEEIKEDTNSNNDTSLYNVGDIWGGTWTYNMTLAMFAKIIAVTPKSVKFQLLGKKQVGGNAWQPKVIPDESKATKTVMVRMPKNPQWGIKVDGYYLYKWDGTPIQEDHMD